MELLDTINSVLKKYDELENEIKKLDDLCEKIPEEQSNTDRLLSDYYHIIENENLSDKSMIDICKKIHDIRKQRREYDFCSYIISTYKKNKNKIMISPNTNRAMFRNSIKQTIKDFPTKYKFRVLSEKEVEDIINKTDKTEEMIEEIKKNETPKKEIAKKYGVSLPLIYYYSKKIRNEK